ncbi:MAG: septal ring lytic transglycosylase RlpA family protein, partial [Candidatus Methylomirabilales bacterium]
MLPGRLAILVTRRNTAALALSFLLAACTTGQLASTSAPHTGAATGANKPYTVHGVRYVPYADPDYDAVGLASWYGDRFHRRRTASGQRFDMTAMTAAHTTLPFGTRVRVTNLENGHSAVLSINDRGPFKKDRIIDVSRHAAEHLGFRRQGTARVRVQVISGSVKAEAPGQTEPLDVVDLSAFQWALNTALNGPRNSEFVWQDSETGSQGSVTPLTTPANKNGPLCRNYRRTMTIGQNEEEVYVGRACLNADGSWTIKREK